MAQTVLGSIRPIGAIAAASVSLAYCECVQAILK